jgi:TldD protein
MSIKEQIEFCKDLDGYISSKYPDLQARNVVLQSATMEKNLITSDGALSHYEIPRSFLIFIMTLMNGSEPISLHDVVGGYGQFQDLFANPSDHYQMIDEMYTHLRAKKEAVWAEAGVHDVVMNAKLAGILSHEAVGHTTEADIVLNGSVAGDMLNQQVASELVTMVDVAHHYQGELLPQPVFVDDEGTEAKDAVLIEKGILKGFMHTRETAKKFGVEPTGNARAYNFSDEPLVRMRNTMIVPGTSKLEDMIADVENGYYLIDPSNGQADSTSEFMFGVTLGYEIKNGKLGKAIKDTTISGVAFELLKTITDLSDDLTWISSGMCGKKQPMPVGMGGPAIRCKVMIGGK